MVFISCGDTDSFTFVPSIANDFGATYLSHSSMSVSRALRGVRLKVRTASAVLPSVSYKRTMKSSESSAFLTDSTVTFAGSTFSALNVLESSP